MIHNYILILKGKNLNIKLSLNNNSIYIRKLWVFIENNTTIQFNDYSFINTTILSNKPNKQDVIQLISIIKRGAFLNNLEYEWLDRFRQTVTDSIIDYLTNYVSTYRKEDDINLLIEIPAEAVKPVFSRILTRIS